MQQLYAQTDFKNIEDKQAAQALTMLVLASLVLYTILILSGLYWRDWALIYVAAGGFVFQALPFWLLKRGKVLAASVVLMVSTLTLVTAFATVGQGIHDVALVAFPIVFVFAGLTFNRRVLILCIALTIAAIGWLVLGQINGWFTPISFSATTGWSDFLVTSVILLMAVFSVDLLSGNLRNNLQRLRSEIIRREKTETALRESEQRYKTLFESAAEGILIADIETHRQRYANPTICKMLGYSQDELQKMSIYDIHPKEALELVDAEFSAQARGEKITSLLPCLKKDGTIIYTDINATKAVIDGRESNIGFFIDVTERVNAEKQIKTDIIEKDALIKKLQDAAAKIDTLSGLIPMCAWCKKIRNDQGYWQGVEQYISEHSKADFTHSICADCQKKYFPEIDFENDK
jgi:PAS domain S-box-containing protein